MWGFPYVCQSTSGKDGKMFGEMAFERKTVKKKNS